MLQLVPLQQCEEVTVTNEDKLGVMRIDWADDDLCNKWSSSTSFQTLCDECEISIPHLQKEINKLMFEQLDDFSKIIYLCNGNSYSDEPTFQVEGEDVIYYVKLIPVRDAYSAIIVYKK